MGGKQSSTKKFKEDITDEITANVKTAVTTSADASCSNDVSLIGCSNISNMHVKQHCSVSADLKSTLKAVQDTTLTNKMVDSITSKLNQSIQNMSFNITDQESKSIYDQVYKLATTVNQTVSSVCSSVDVLNNSVTCKDSKNINNVWIDQEAAAKQIASSTVNSDQVSKATNDLQKSIEDITSQKQKNAIWGFVMLLLAAAALVAVFFIAPAIATKEVGGSALMIAIGVLFFILANVYLYEDCVQGSFPAFHIFGIGIPPSICPNKILGAIDYIVVYGMAFLIGYIMLKKSSDDPTVATDAATNAAANVAVGATTTNVAANVAKNAPAVISKVAPNISSNAIPATVTSAAQRTAQAETQATQVAAQAARLIARQQAATR